MVNPELLDMTKRVQETTDVLSKEFRKTFKKFFALLSEDEIVECKDPQILQQWLDILEGDGPGICDDKWIDENEGMVQEYIGQIEAELDELASI